MNNVITKNMSGLVFKLGLAQNKDYNTIKLIIESYRLLWYQLLGNGCNELTNEQLRSLHGDMDKFNQYLEVIQGTLITNEIKYNHFVEANSLIDSSEKIKSTVRELGELLNAVEVNYWEGTK